MCCYLSPTYGELYSDGYGLNFYTHEYGYYEYCNNDPLGEDVSASGSGGTAIGLGIFAAIVLIVGGYCYNKRNEGKEEEEE